MNGPNESHAHNASDFGVEGPYLWVDMPANLDEVITLKSILHPCGSLSISWDRSWSLGKNLLIYDPRCSSKPPHPPHNKQPLRLPSNPCHITGALDLKIYSSNRFLHLGVAANNPFIRIAGVEGNGKKQRERNVWIKLVKWKRSSDDNYVSACLPAVETWTVRYRG
jgi:hypothetical protein